MILNYIKLVGQSLASGAEGTPPFPTVKNGKFWMLGDNIGSSPQREGNFPISADAIIKEYNEPIQESILGGFTRYMQKFHPNEIFAYAYCGIGGEGLEEMSKGKPAYAKGLEQDKRIVAWAKANGYELRVTIFMINGENNSGSFNVSPKNTYLNLIRNYRFDAMTDFAAMGYTSSIKMFASQTSTDGFYYLLLKKLGWTANTLPPKHASVAAVQSDLANNEPDNFVMVSAKQDLEYASDYSSHLTSGGYSQHGEKFAQAYSKVFFQNQSWKPLQLRSARMKNATTIVADFDVPVAPLSWDTTISDPGAKGFSLASGIALSNVQIISERQVELTMAAPFTTGVDRLQYAWGNWVDSGLYNDLGYPGKMAGKQYGSRGQLQDSDSISGSNYNQANHCIHCTVPIFGVDTKAPEPAITRILVLNSSNARELF